MPRDRAERFVQAVEASGLTVRGVGLNFLAQLTALGALGRLSAQAGEGAALLDVGAADTQFTVAQGRQALFCRSLPLGGRDLAVAAERASLEIIDEIKKSRIYLEKTKRAESFRKIYLFGGASVEAGLAGLLRERLRVEVEDDISGRGCRSLGACGQSLAALDPHVLWLIPPHDRMDVWRKRWNDHRRHVTAGFIFLCLAATFFLNRAFRRNEDHLQQLQRDLRGRQGPVPVVKGRTYSEGRALPIVLGVLRRTPAGATLAELRYDALQKKVSVRGRAADYAKVSEFTSGLAAASDLRAVRAGRASLVEGEGRPVVEFSIDGELR
jgi:hypothetical protein